MPVDDYGKCLSRFGPLRKIPAPDDEQVFEVMFSLNCDFVFSFLFFFPFVETLHESLADMLSKLKANEATGSRLKKQVEFGIC